MCLCRQDVRRAGPSPWPNPGRGHAGGVADVPRDGRAARRRELRLRQRDQEADQRDGAAATGVQPLGGKITLQSGQIIDKKYMVLKTAVCTF